MRGGKREGAGRPFGTKKEPTVIYYRRVKPEWVQVLDNKIEKLKGFKMKNYTENEIIDSIMTPYISGCIVDFEQFGEFEELVREKVIEYDKAWDKLEYDAEGFNSEQQKIADELDKSFAQEILKIIGQ